MKMTHTGTILGCDARTPNGWSAKRKFRETKLYWIDQHYFRYSKKWNGRGVGDWPMYRLDLDSLKPIEERDRSAGDG